MTLEKRIKKVLKETIIPRLQLHQGGVELVEVDEKEKIAKLKFIGMCLGCPYATMTFESLVEAELMSQIPELKKIENINLIEDVYE